MSERVPTGALPQDAKEQPFIAALERMHAEDIFGEPETRAAWLRQTSWTDAERYLTWTNALCRELSYRDRLREPRHSLMLVLDEEKDSMTFEDITSKQVMYVAPETHHRKPAMCYAFETVRQSPDLESAATLLRTAVFLTHRYSNGNTRLGAIADSLLTRGYDGSEQDKNFYRTLTRGREGIIENGIDIQTAFLAEEFAAHALAKTVQQYAYDGELPTRLTNYYIPDLSNIRPDLEWRGAHRVSLQLAERSLGRVLLVQHMLENGVRPDEYLEWNIHGEPLALADEFFATLAPTDLDDIITASNGLKYSFVRSVVDCFRGDETIYGPYREVAERIRAGESGSIAAETTEDIA